MAFGENPDNGLGGKLGIIAILHTWTQAFNDHFYLHCFVPGGALSCDGQKWLDCNNRFLFPAKALSKVFRGKFIAYLEDAFQKGLLKFPGNTRSLGTKEGFKQLIKLLWSKGWVCVDQRAN